MVDPINENDNVQRSGELLDPEVVARIKNIQIRAKHLVNSTFAGEYKSAFRGRGQEFDEVREYIPGDDVRSIDWNVTARNNHPFIKIYRDERELTVVFVVDLSGSNQFGSTNKLKSDIIAEITAMLSYMALRNNDKVGLLIFSDHIEKFIPPKKGRGHIWRLIREILTYEKTNSIKSHLGSQSKGTNLALPLEYLNKIIKEKSVVFMLSDFKGENYEREMKLTSKRHDFIAILIKDQREIFFPDVGFIELMDAETNETIIVNTSNRKMMNRYMQNYQKKETEIKYFFQTNGIELIEIENGKSYCDPLVKFFRRREKLKGH